MCVTGHPSGRGPRPTPEGMPPAPPAHVPPPATLLLLLLRSARVAGQRRTPSPVPCRSRPGVPLSADGLPARAARHPGAGLRPPRRGMLWYRAWTAPREWSWPESHDPRPPPPAAGRRRVQGPERRRSPRRDRWSAISRPARSGRCAKEARLLLPRRGPSDSARRGRRESPRRNASSRPADALSLSSLSSAAGPSRSSLSMMGCRMRSAPYRVHMVDLPAIYRSADPFETCDINITSW